MVDEEDLDALPDREVRCLAERRGQLLQVVMKERPEHVTPVPARQPPGGGPQDVVLAVLRMGQKPALPQRVREPKDTAAVNADQVGELPQGDRCGRSRDGFENSQAAIEALDRRGVVHRFPAHHLR